MNKIYLTGKIKDYPSKKEDNLIYTFKADELEQDIKLKIYCVNEDIKTKIIDMFAVDTSIIITGTMEIKDNRPIIILEQFQFLQTYTEKILSLLMTPEEVQDFINNSELDWESIMNDADED